jgi:hypothetical protein
LESPEPKFTERPGMFASLPVQFSPTVKELRMPRKSKNSHLSLIHSNPNPRPRLGPIHPLSKTTRKIFDSIIAENQHLRRTDIPLLECLAVASARLNRVEKLSVGDLLKLSRIITSLNRTLRLTPQARIDPKTLGRSLVKNKHLTPWTEREPIEAEMEVEEDNDPVPAA